MAATDMELLASWRDGDGVAANELFERYFDRLHRFFSTKTDRGVEDLIQETLLACVNSRDTLRNDTSFRALVFGIARRLLFRGWRDRQRGANAIDFGLTSVADLGPSPSSVVAQREEQLILLEALRHIPVDLQILLELFYWENLRAVEVAEILEIPEGTVRSRLRRARRMLDEVMKQRTGDVVPVVPDRDTSSPDGVDG